MRTQLARRVATKYQIIAPSCDAPTVRTLNQFATNDASKLRGFAPRFRLLRSCCAATCVSFIFKDIFHYLFISCKQPEKLHFELHQCESARHDYQGTLIVALNSYLLYRRTACCLLNRVLSRRSETAKLKLYTLYARNKCDSTFKSATCQLSTYKLAHVFHADNLYNVIFAALFTLFNAYIRTLLLAIVLFIWIRYMTM